MSGKPNVMELERLTLRPWKHDDDRSLIEHANDYDVWINVTDRFPHPYKLSDAQDWIGASIKTGQDRDFAIVVEGMAVGGIGIMPQRDVFQRSAEVGYWLGKAYWGRGIMTEALAAVTDYAFHHFDICRLYAGVFAWNPASAKVLEKCGYEFEGRLRKAITKAGKTTDQLLYSKIL
jgi:ribosomal-protein-alanine N-acetyltransferase